MTIESDLRGIDFSDNEVKVYIALLKIGKAKAGRIAKECSLDRTSVYNALKKLQEYDALPRKDDSVLAEKADLLYRAQEAVSQHEADIRARNEEDRIIRFMQLLERTQAEQKQRGVRTEEQGETVELTDVSPSLETNTIRLIEQWELLTLCKSDCAEEENTLQSLESSLDELEIQRKGIVRGKREAAAAQSEAEVIRATLDRLRRVLKESSPPPTPES